MNLEKEIQMTIDLLTLLWAAGGLMILSLSVDSNDFEYASSFACFASYGILMVFWPVIILFALTIMIINLIFKGRKNG